MQIVKTISKPDPEAHILAMWLLFLRAPAKSEPDTNGFFDLGEVGTAREKNWSKATVYSPAQREINGLD
jgi:hypothetical protein